MWHHLCGMVDASTVMYVMSDKGLATRTHMRPGQRRFKIKSNIVLLFPMSFLTTFLPCRCVKMSMLRTAACHDKLFGITSFPNLLLPYDSADE